MQPLSTYIGHPELLTPEVVNELAELVARNPSYQAARLLLVRGLYQLQDERFGAELRKAALFLPDRTVLYHLLEDEKLQLAEVVKPQAPRKKLEAAADRTQSLIESFLDQLPETPQPRKSHPVDASVDYISYLMQQPDADAVLEATLEEEEIRNLDTEDEDEQPALIVPISTPEKAQETVNDPYFTETLAHIYIKQGKYIKAIEIIRRLSLNYPKKNRYFADQIRFLEKLITNEQSKNEENNQK
ncbi:MAG: hypothetical protein K6G70_09015 [Bacteroidaceae bacterium]|nr:hypothetical protein [Bacteroidaceae bacterium]